MRSPARPGWWGWAVPEACLDTFEEDTISCPYQDSNSGSSSPTQYHGRQLFHATPAVVEYEKEVTYTVSDTELHFADISFGSRQCHRLSWQFLGRLRQYLHAQNPGKSLGYVTSASFDILLNSFANDPTRAVQKFRAPDCPGDWSLSGGA
jgi:hypothetical protein